ncbi:MAG: hypothetical protein Q7T03_06915 [Deltaproteobacteria bacterium]|nr:hypothetical protein [Deltaproteobacteria bacterium]
MTNPSRFATGTSLLFPNREVSIGQFALKAEPLQSKKETPVVPERVAQNVDSFEINSSLDGFESLLRGKTV